MDKNKIHINKIFYKLCIPYYNIIEIEEPYIMTMSKVIFLYPEDKIFWIELKNLYGEYYNINEDYFCKTDNLYEKLFAIKLELNEEMFEEHDGHIIKRVPIYIAYFIMLKNLLNFCKNYSLYDDYSKIKDEINKCIKEYKGKPNFA
ncbi:hypothetical protein FACS1894142_5700 [Spirochaetia bacterium]|nr:hypothetical protein FACS1894142_5700 [Spirochaetia bacterium]